jgi:GNAT superfamily N-acetyltransferase
MSKFEDDFALASDFHIDVLLEMMQEFYDYDHLTFHQETARKALNGILNNDSFGRVYLIKSGDEVVGYIVITFGYSLEFHGRDAFIDELFIFEEHRGKGLGQRAIEFAEEICRLHNVKALHLEVGRANAKAQYIYRKAGFADHDRYLMTKRL